MPRCYICGKKPTNGKKIIRTGTGKWIKKRVPRLRRPNLQPITLTVGNSKKRVKVCAKCLKRLKKEGKLIAISSRNFDSQTVEGKIE